jgi:hypothetical protein
MIQSLRGKNCIIIFLGLCIRIRIDLSCCIRMRIHEGKNYPYRKKSRIFIIWSAGCSLLRAEGFSCSLCVLYGCLRISILQFSIQKIEKTSFIAVNFNQFLVIKPLDSDSYSDPDPQLGKRLDPDQHYINADPQPWLFYHGVMSSQSDG